MRNQDLASHLSGDRLSRRTLLRLAAVAPLGLTLPSRLDALPTSEPATRSCILLWLHGGLSHIDSFDPKPNAPSEIRGEFRAIQTRVPGVHLSEALPRLALLQNRFAILRGLDSGNATHGMAEAIMMTGHPFHPTQIRTCFGSLAAYALSASPDVTAFVQLGSDLDSSLGGGTAGPLGPQYNPWMVDDAARPRITFNGCAIPSPPALTTATLLDAESPRLRDLYGATTLGRRCLQARRLIEAGARFVTVTSGGWDTHKNLSPAFRTQLLPEFDAALAALLQDLADRGLIQSTMVVVLTDFGRTPRINRHGGRDHHDRAGIALLAGGTIPGGLVLGRTDPTGDHTIDPGLTPADLAATILTHLQISQLHSEDSRLGSSPNPVV